MMIGTWAINLFAKYFSRFRCNRFAARPVRRPKIRMVRDGSILGVNPRRRGIEQMETLSGNARDDFGGHATPRERFADRQESSGSGNRGQHSGGIEWFHRTQIDYLDLESLFRDILSRA